MNAQFSRYNLVFGTVLICVVSMFGSSCSGSKKASTINEKATASVGLRQAEDESKEAAIRRQFHTYFGAMETGDWTQSLDYLYPRLFEQIPRSTVLWGLEQMNADTSAKISMDSALINEISEVLVMGDSAYARLDYSFRMTMKIIPLEESPADSILNDADGGWGDDYFDEYEFTASTIEGVYGPKNVRRNDAEKTLYIKIHATMLAISEPAFEGWYFLEKKENMIPLLQRILPSAVLEL